MKSYTLKLYNDPLISFDVSQETFGRISVHNIELDEAKRCLFPPQLICETTGSKIESWLKARTVPKHRQYVDKIFEQAGIDYNDTMAIIELCKGLSVNDSYWVDDGSGARFEDINLFDNPFDETLGIVAYTGYTTTQKHKIGLSSEWTTEGTYPKAWRRIGEDLFLFKSGMEFGAANDGYEPYSEYLAAQVAERMGIDHVDYDLRMWKGKLASVCELINDKDTSLVPFHAATNQTSFPTTLASLNSFSDEMSDAMRTMLIFDALICNRDRHAANYGLLRDNQTGSFIAFAPLFDHNQSLFSRAMKTDYDQFFELARAINNQPPSSPKSHIEIAGLIMGELQHEQLRKMIGFEFKNHPNYPLDEERISALNTYIQQKTIELLNIPVVSEKVFNQEMRQERERFIEQAATPLYIAGLIEPSHDQLIDVKLEAPRAFSPKADIAQGKKIARERFADVESLGKHGQQVADAHNRDLGYQDKPQGLTR